MRMTINALIAHGDGAAGKNMSLDRKVKSSTPPSVVNLHFFNLLFLLLIYTLLLMLIYNVNTLVSMWLSLLH